MSPSRPRMLHIAGFVGLCVLMANATGVAQTPKTTSISVIPYQGDERHLWLLLSAVGTPAPPGWFTDSSSPGRIIQNYKIYEVTNANSSLSSLKDVSPEQLALTGKVQMRLGNMATLPLKQPLHSDRTYLVEAKDATGNLLDASITAMPTLASSDAKHLRNALFVNANVPLKESYPPNSVTVTYNPGQGKPTLYPARVLGARQSLGLEIWLDEPLPAGASNSLQLTVDGITDFYGVAVPISGPIASAPSAPTDATKDFISIQLSAIAAVHSAPTFSATGVLAPLHIAKNAVVWPGQIHVDPSVIFDTGSASAQTANAVTLPSQFIRPFLLGLPKPPTNLIELNSRKPSNITVLNAMGGLRAEFDTQYGGTNLMGEGRAEFYFSKLYFTADAHTASVAAANPSIRSTLNLPTNGWSITPYLQYDGGGHVTAQSIANTSAGLPNVNIPAYSISRIYFGSQATIQLGISSVTFDGSWVELFDPETGPFTASNVVSPRTVSGLQPHAKGTYNISLDQENHFSGSIAWENGRSAPSFEYLNKVTVGLQVIY